MIKIGITGQNGFIGWHLARTASLRSSNFEVVNFERSFYDNEGELDGFVSSCDVIVHLAGMNRHEDPEFLYKTNIELAKKLVISLERTKSNAHVLFSSSSQELNENLYGKSKKEARKILEEWSDQNSGRFTGLVIPNVFGPFGRPFYNSVVATFCHQINIGENPRIDQDSQLNLIYIGELVEKILTEVVKGEGKKAFKELVEIPHTSEVMVSTLLEKLRYFEAKYLHQHEIPVLQSTFDSQLFNTFRCFMPMDTAFPRKFKLNADQRGAFVELAKTGISGQTSFSTTFPNITRGNHFHTRKIERFAVIKGKAKIQLRKVGNNEVFNYYLDGDEPAYVDMPIWYTHNITNIGEDVLYTVFWINEPYDPLDPDTWIEIV